MVGTHVQFQDPNNPAEELSGVIVDKIRVSSSNMETNIDAYLIRVTTTQEYIVIEPWQLTKQLA